MLAGFTCIVRQGGVGVGRIHLYCQTGWSWCWQDSLVLSDRVELVLAGFTCIVRQGGVGVGRIHLYYLTG